LNAFKYPLKKVNMHPYQLPPSHAAAYYAAYFIICFLLIAALSWILHAAGRIFLNDAFAGNSVLVRTVQRLLDIGFYLVSIGYVALTYSTYVEMDSYDTVVKIVSFKVGGLLLLLGVSHVFNLLLLALFRQRRGGAATATGA
jgi:hypothetical protein